MSGSREKGSVGKRKRHWEQGNHKGTIWEMNDTLTGCTKYGSSGGLSLDLAGSRGQPTLPGDNTAIFVPLKSQGPDKQVCKECTARQGGCSGIPAPTSRRWSLFSCSFILWVDSWLSCQECRGFQRGGVAVELPICAQTALATL